MRSGSSGGGKVVISFMVLSVGQACNFKCRDCGNFEPYSPREFLRYSAEDITGEMETLISYVERVDEIQVQGGEPFCHSDLVKVLEYLGQKKDMGKIRDITIATNGSIMPSDELFAIIKKYDMLVRISNYKIEQAKALALKKRCGQEGIRCMLFSFASKEGYWYNVGGIDTPRENDDEEVKKRFRTCAFNGCLTLEHGQFAYCSRGADSYKIQGFERKSGDYLVVSDRKGFKKELVRYITKKHYMEACRYCNGTREGDRIPPAVQLSK